MDCGVSVLSILVGFVAVDIGCAIGERTVVRDIELIFLPLRATLTSVVRVTRAFEEFFEIHAL